jgi:predicted nucleotide-binding protein
MAAKTRPQLPPQSASLTLEQVRSALPKLERRIGDLQTFDVSTIRERGDSRVEALAAKVDGTLAEIFGYGTIEYRQYAVYSLDTLSINTFGEQESLARIRVGYQAGIEGAVSKLTVLKELWQERLEDEHQSRAEEPAAIAPSATGRVFIVHGHDDAAKSKVARFVQNLGFAPVILHEQPNMGLTIVEKFEKNSQVDYAVVLLTPDDIGYAKREPDQLRARARQNVVLELGYFIARLGRQRVCVLHSGDVEIPSDYHGVIYVPLDGGDAWHLKLAKEMKIAGLDIDLNKAM